MADPVSSLLGNLSSRVISPTDSEEQKLNKTLLIFASSLMGFATMLWLALYWTMGIKFSMTVPFTYLVASAAALFFYLWNRDFEFYRFVQVSLFLFVPFVMQWSIGSFVDASGVSLFALLAPIGVMMLQSPRASIPWFFAFVAFIGVSGFFDYYIGYLNDPPIVPMKTIGVFFALNFAAMASIVYLLFSYFVREKARLQVNLENTHRLLVIEQEKSERLLLSMLPQKIADRLKEERSAIADHHSDVTVMFADIVNFTGLSERMPPKQIVALLNEVFSEFDQLAEKYGLEKIKTIGDAYMVAGGLGENQKYTEAMANMALDAQELIAKHEMLAHEQIGIHIGISTGPVVAGVIGVTRFVYDLWGNTVNVASRLASEARAGIIMIDDTSYKRLSTQFRFAEADQIMIKGKGQMTIYRLLGRLDAPHASLTSIAAL